MSIFRSNDKQSSNIVAGKRHVHLSVEQALSTNSQAGRNINRTRSYLLYMSTLEASTTKRRSCRVCGTSGYKNRRAVNFCDHRSNGTTGGVVSLSQRAASIPGMDRKWAHFGSPARRNKCSCILWGSWGRRGARSPLHSFCWKSGIAVRPAQR